MIEIITDTDHLRVMQKVRDLTDKGYVIKGAECAKNFYGGIYPPFVYTVILIKNL